MSGWVKIHRKLLEWEWYDDTNVFKLFMTIMLRANYRESKWRGSIIAPGQLLAGRKKLAEWSNLTEQEVKTCLSKLVATSELTIKATNRYSVYTLTNWACYQLDDAVSTSESTSHGANNQTTIKQQSTTSKKNKKEKKERNKNICVDFDFESIYQKYPRKVGKSSGMAKLAKTIKTVETYEKFTKSVNNFLEEHKIAGTDLKYVPHFSTFVNRWQDYLEENGWESEHKARSAADKEHDEKEKLYILGKITPEEYYGN